MSNLFISDLHLDPSRPGIVDLFVDLLAHEARTAAALYILGDLFESWIGDDDDASLAAQVADATRALRDAGVPVYFMHGNRDFLLGETYAARAGMILLRDPSIIDVGGQRTLLMHGDTLCTDDVEYLKFRAMVRDPRWQQQFLARPLAERRAYAAQARSESRRHSPPAPGRRSWTSISPRSPPRKRCGDECTASSTATRIGRRCIASISTVRLQNASSSAIGTSRTASCESAPRRRLGTFI